MKTLVIIDFQKDFANPKGSLYVNGAELAEENLVHYINTFHSEISDIVFTLDWHPINHCSFQKCGGKWPTHCVAYTEGAGVSNVLVNAAAYWGIPIKFFLKGRDTTREEYGAFANITTWGGDDGSLQLFAQDINKNPGVTFDSNNIVVAGIAGDYCVKESIDNLVHSNLPFVLNIQVLSNCIASIDGTGNTLVNYIKFVKENKTNLINIELA